MAVTANARIAPTAITVRLVAVFICLQPFFVAFPGWPGYVRSPPPERRDNSKSPSGTLLLSSRAKVAVADSTTVDPWVTTVLSCRVK